MKKWNQLSISKKLIISVLAISLTSSLLMIGIFVERISRNLEEEIEQKITAITRSYSTSFESNLSELKKIVNALDNEFSRRIEHKPLSAEQIDTVLSDMAPIVEMLAQNSGQGNTAYIYIDPSITGEVHDVYYADQNGDGIVERQAEIPKSYYEEAIDSYTLKEWWYGPKNTGLPYWTTPYKWKFDNGKSATFVSYTKPLYIDGQFIGVVGSDLLYDEIVKTIDRINIEGEGHAFLIDQYDEFLILPEEHDDIYNQSPLYKSGEHETFELNDDITLYHTDLEGDKVISSIVTLENHWHFGISVFEDEIFKDLRETLNFVVGILLMIAVVMGYAFYKVGQSITRPIIDLAEYVDDFENQAYEDIVFLEEDVRHDEIGHLRHAIQEMIERIRSNIFYINAQNETLKEEMTKNKKMRSKLEIAFDALSSTNDGILIIDKQMNVIYFNQSLLKQFGLTKESIDDELFDLFPSEGQNEFLFNLKQWTIRRTQDNRMMNFSGTLHGIGEEGDVFLAIYKDITSTIRQENKLEELKTRDLLTGLYNRYGFENAITEFIETTHEERMAYPLLLINVDHFRSINDSLGYQQANEFLKKMAETLKSIFGEACIVSRTNGDEFGIFINQDYSGEDIEGYLKERISKIGKFFTINMEKIYFNYSVGVSVIGMDSSACSDGIDNAHSALNFAKERKELQMAFFNQEVLKLSVENYQMIKGLREAIESKAFELYYQPKWHTKEKKCVGMEVLARWRWNGVYVQPDIFIKVAEYNNMMIEIGEIIFEKAVAFIKDIRGKGYDIPVSINVSGIQFTKGYFENYVSDILKREEIKAEWLEIELTESILMQNHEEANSILLALSELGMQVSIDDFGKGYSSLNYLKKFKVDTLKVDRDFIKDYPDKDDGSLAKLIIDLSKLLDVSVVAEGIETEAQLEMIERCGCQVIQGYYISPPLNEETTLDWIANHNH